MTRTDTETDYPDQRQQDEQADPPTHSAHTRIVLRPLASSTPLAFYAFGTGTVLYMAAQLQWIPLAQDKPLGILLLAFVAPLQLLAGLIAYAARDGGLATAMAIFGASWACLGVTDLTSTPGSRTALLGIFLLAIATVLVTIGAAAVRARPLLGLLALVAVARYALSGVYEIAGGGGIQQAAGWLGVPIIAISLYGGTAFLLEDTMHRTVLPIGRRHSARDAVQADFADQIEHLGTEAGVRHQL